MRRFGSVAAGVTIAVVLAGAAILAATQGPAGLALEPVGRNGESVTPAFEGWYRNADGSYTLLLGYFNRNRAQELDIPVGPNNRIEPGGPDQGQPTHFLTRRQWGVFTIKVPKDFGSKRLTWTLVSNGQTLSIPVGIIPDYTIEPLEDAAMGNTPPVLKFEPAGPAHTGPPIGFAAAFKATVSEPLNLTVWAMDKPPKREVPPLAGMPPEPPLSISWSKFRGPGVVKIAVAKPPINKEDGKATTAVTFDQPGDYVLRVQGNDSSGDGGLGFQCCWTNALVQVSVAPAARR